MFKSDRCGIEMTSQFNITNSNFRFKSDRCGIEILDYHLYKKVNNAFKSDRCGIEIEKQEITDIQSIKVQIRPLRD